MAVVWIPALMEQSSSAVPRDVWCEPYTVQRPLRNSEISACLLVSYQDAPCDWRHKLILVFLFVCVL